MNELDAAARALSAFDPLSALNLVALRKEPRALALRGVALAQLGDYPGARKLLARAEKGLRGIDRARCIAAQGEAALADRDLAVARARLDVAAKALDRSGDRANALFARLTRVRCGMWLGELDDAESVLGALEIRGAPPGLRALAALVGAELAVRRLRASTARALLRSASESPALAAEVARVESELASPVARLVRGGVERLVVLAEIESLSAAFVIDGCRRQIRAGARFIDLVGRPVLLALACALGSRAEVSRSELIERAFDAKRVNDSLRVRLRVEIGRLRKLLGPHAAIEATESGFALRAADICVLLPPEAGGEVLALLRGGGAWSTASIAAAVGANQRVVQRALAALKDATQVDVIGRGRASRWIARPSGGFATALLLLRRAPGG